jgi:hypothetical protein
VEDGDLASADLSFTWFNLNQNLLHSEAPGQSVYKSYLNNSMKEESEAIAYVIRGNTGRQEPWGNPQQSSNRLGRFICGPIPLYWMQRAAMLPRCGLMVALAVAFCRGLERSNSFRLSPARLRELCVTRSSATRGVAALETAGLIRVKQRKLGQALTIEVLGWDLYADGAGTEEGGASWKRSSS